MYNEIRNSQLHDLDCFDPRQYLDKTIFAIKEDIKNVITDENFVKLYPDFEEKTNEYKKNGFPCKIQELARLIELRNWLTCQKENDHLTKINDSFLNEHPQEFVQKDTHFENTLDNNDSEFSKEITNPHQEIGEKRIKDEVKILPDETEEICSLDVSPCGNDIIVGSYDHKIYMRHYEHIVMNKKEFTGHTDVVRTVQCGYLNEQNQTDLSIISGSDDGFIRVWDTKNQTCKSELNIHNSVYKIAIPNRNKGKSELIACASDHPEILIGEICDEKISRKTEIQSECNWVTDISFFSDNKKLIAIGSHFKSYLFQSLVKIFDINEPTKVSTLKTPAEGRPWKLVLSSDNNFSISCSWESNQLILHDLRSGQCEKKFNVGERGINDIKLHTDNYLISSSANRTIIFDILNGKSMKSYLHESDAIACAISSLPQPHIISAEKKRLVFLDI